HVIDPIDESNGRAGRVAILRVYGGLRHELPGVKVLRSQKASRESGSDNGRRRPDLDRHDVAVETLAHGGVEQTPARQFHGFSRFPSSQIARPEGIDAAAAAPVQPEDPDRIPLDMGTAEDVAEC